MFFIIMNNNILCCEDTTIVVVVVVVGGGGRAMQKSFRTNTTTRIWHKYIGRRLSSGFLLLKNILLANLCDDDGAYYCACGGRIYIYIHNPSHGSTLIIGPKKKDRGQRIYNIVGPRAYPSCKSVYIITII